MNFTLSGDSYAQETENFWEIDSKIFDAEMLPSTHSMSSDALADSLECLNYEFEEDEFPFSRDLAIVVDETYKSSKEATVGIEAEESTHSRVHEASRPSPLLQTLPIIHEESMQESSGSSTSRPHAKKLTSTLFKAEECLAEEADQNELSFFSAD